MRNNNNNTPTSVSRCCQMTAADWCCVSVFWFHVQLYGICIATRLRLCDVMANCIHECERAFIWFYFIFPPLTFDRVCWVVGSRSKWLFLSSGNSRIFDYEISLRQLIIILFLFFFSFVHWRTSWIIWQQVFSVMSFRLVDFTPNATTADVE